MSYILDALKKADAERAREAAGVPDLYAQGDAADEGARAPSSGSKWLLLALLALLLAGLAWAWWGAARVEPVRLAEPDRSPVPAAAQAPPPAPPTAHAVDVPAAPPLPRPTHPPAVVAPAAAVTTPPHPAPAPAPALAPAPSLASAPAPSAARAPKAASGASAANPAPPAALADLPADLRAQLPPLTVGGSVYSPAAANRIVILNGQVFREGDQPAEGLTVEQIGLKSTVLVFRGVRFELKH